MNTIREISRCGALLAAGTSLLLVVSLHVALALAVAAPLAPGQERQRKTGAADADMAAYLAQLSEKGKERGTKEFTYKRTPQGELRVYFAMPPDWSPGDRRPAVVFFYGGGWSGGNVFSFDEQSEYFAKCGVVAGMADYRVRTRHGVTPDKCVEDARSLVRWVRANGKTLGVDPNRVIAGGGSAGGHIAACTALLDAPDSDTDDLRVSCIPNGLILCYPVASLVDDTRADGFKQVLGSEMADKLSPARHVTKSWPPTVLFFGNTDRLLANGILLHNKAREADVPCELYLAAGQGHGFVNMAPWNYVSAKRAADFFMRAGVLDKAPLPAAPPGELKKYNGEPVEKVYVKTNGNPSKPMRDSRAGKKPPEKSAPTPEERSLPPKTGSGFVRIEQRGGVWWLVGPDDKPFVTLGLNHVSPQVFLASYNREATIERYGTDIVGPNGRFNNDGAGAKKWMESVFADMRDWGFNSLGMHTSPELNVDLYRRGAYYLAWVKPAKIDGWMEGRGSGPEKPDVFSGEFEAKSDEAAKRACGLCAEDPNLLGYCYCDLPHWSGPERSKQGGAKRPTVGASDSPWADALRSQPAGTAGKQAWIDLLKSRHASPAEAAAVYGLGASSWDQLASERDWSGANDAQAAANDSQAFMATIAERWYGVLHAAIRKYDQKHLIFGDKLQYSRIPPFLYPILKKYVDVISIQDEEDLPDQMALFTRVYEGTGKPMISGDSSFSVQHKNQISCKGRHVATYREVGDSYAAYLKGMLSLPFVVGWHYCGYVECWNALDRIPGNTGFKDPLGNVYTEAVGRVRAANALAIEWHRASKP